MPSLIPWSNLTRNGTPPLRVIRPFNYLGEVRAVGQIFNDPAQPVRMRQLYEQRKVAPVALTDLEPKPVGRTVSKAATVEPSVVSNPLHSEFLAPSASRRIGRNRR